MNSFRVFKLNPRFVAVAAALLIFAALPVMVSAAQLTERSIAVSSSSVEATGVQYDVKFTAPSEAEAFVIDFCSNSPVIGQECLAPAGFNVGTATANGGFTISSLANNTVSLTSATAINGSVEVTLSGVTNPSNAGTMYARIVTYADAAAAANYESETVGATLDEGGVAIAITPTVGVSGSVLEAMTFCVSRVAPTEDCGDTQAPVIQLGDEQGDTTALSTEVSEGSLFAQISTNAVSGVIVSLKSSALGCGGLLLAGGPENNCYIKPALAGGISSGEAKFGLRVLPADNTSSNSIGDFVAFNDYNNETFVMNFSEDNSTGVTSPYGDQVLTTNGAPANNKNVELVFGAAISNDTPAGVYSTDLSMIATGKF